MKDRVIIWGAKDLGRYAVGKLRNEGYIVTAIIDNSAEAQGKTIEGIPVLSAESILYESNNKNTILILTVMNSKSVFEVLGQIENFGFKNIGILKPRAGKYGLSLLLDLGETEGEIVWYVKDGEKTQIIPRLEVNLIDNCNLNCVGCTHFSSIYGANSILPYKQFEKELKQIRKIGKYVRLRLLGGEPFMVPMLEQYIRTVREIFPETDIEIVTNGLLVGQLKAETLRAMKDCEISIVITLYKPTMQLKEKIAEVLNSYELWWSFDGTLTTEFSRQLTLDNSHDGYEASKKCISSGCLFLRNGKIYKCPIAGLLNDFARYYNLDPVPDTGISIYDDSFEVYKEIEKCAKAPTAICNYCSEEIEMIPWTVKRNAGLNDWLYQSDGVLDKEKVE